MSYVVKVNHRTREIHIHYDTCFNYVFEMQSEHEWTGDWSPVLATEEDAFDYAESETKKMASATIFSVPCQRCYLEA